MKHKLGRLEISIRHDSKKSVWGRFGGGWNWELGFQCGGRTIIFNLLVFSIRFYLKKKEETK